MYPSSSRLSLGKVISPQDLNPQQLLEGIDNDLQFFCELGQDYTNSSAGLSVLYEIAPYQYLVVVLNAAFRSINKLNHHTAITFSL